MAKVTELFVNGKAVRIDAEGERSLLSVLRYDLDLTGSKYGCGEGECTEHCHRGHASVPKRGHCLSSRIVGVLMSELARGGGGPRCMSLPLRRAAL